MSTLRIAGGYRDTLELSRSLVATLRPQNTPLDRADALRRHAVHLNEIAGEFEDTHWQGRRSRALTSDQHLHQVMHADFPILAALFHLGRWEELLPVLEEHVAAFRLEPAMDCQLVRDGPAIGAAALHLLGRVGEAREVAALLGGRPARRPRGLQCLAGTVRDAQRRPGHRPGHLRRQGAGGSELRPTARVRVREALAALGDWDAATAFLPAAREAIPGNAMLVPMVDRVEGQARVARGDVEAGLRLVEGAATGFAQLEASFEERRTREVFEVSVRGAPSAAPARAQRRRGPDRSEA